MFTFLPRGSFRRRGLVERAEGSVVVSPRHPPPLHIEQPARAASHAGAVCLFAAGDRGAHLAVPGPEEARQRMQDALFVSPPRKGGLIWRPLPPKRRVTQPFGITVRNGPPVRPSSRT